MCTSRQHEDLWHPLSLDLRCRQWLVGADHGSAQAALGGGMGGADQRGNGGDRDKRDVDARRAADRRHRRLWAVHRSEEHTSELQSLMRISYAVFCLTKKTTDK